MVTLKQVSDAMRGLLERRGATMKQIHKFLRTEYGDSGAPSSSDIKKALERGFQNGHLERSSTGQTPRFLLQTSTARPAKIRIRAHAFAAKSTSKAKGKRKRKIFHCVECCCCKIMRRMGRKPPKNPPKNKRRKPKGKAKSEEGRKSVKKNSNKREKSKKDKSNKSDSKGESQTPVPMPLLP